MEPSDYRGGSLSVDIGATGSVQLTRCQGRRAMLHLTPEEAELLHRLLDAARRQRCHDAGKEPYDGAP